MFDVRSWFQTVYHETLRKALWGGVPPVCFPFLLNVRLELGAMYSVSKGKVYTAFEFSSMMLLPVAIDLWSTVKQVRGPSSR